ncbi:MAG: DUF6220 domain-containing protein [Solirubrobacteraceae bacterium]
MRAIRTMRRWLAAVIVAAVAVQFLLAGAGAFHATSFRAHTALGWATAFLSLLTVIAAALARRELRASILLFAAVAAQVLLGVLGENSSGWFGALHGLNAVVVMAAATNLARRSVGARSDRPVASSRPVSADTSSASTGTPSR